MGLLLVASALGLSACSGMLYRPAMERRADPARSALQYDDLWIPSADATRLHAWYFKSGQTPRPKALIVFFHGNAGNVSSHFATLAWVLPHGYDYLVFDYRGYWQTGGRSSPENTVQDGMAILRYAHERFPEVPLIVFGQSLGGAVALRSLIELRHEVPVRLVVIDSSFTSYRAAGRGVLARRWLTWPLQPLSYLALSDRWAPGGRVAEIAPTPIVVMHGDRDPVIGYRLGRTLFERSGEPKELWTIEGGSHTDAFRRHGDRYRERFLTRLAGAVGEAPALVTDRTSGRR